ncbi:MAG: hypothetical protein AAGA83_24795 [Cyanobacteria bacterium P01_F01_bin.116]
MDKSIHSPCKDPNELSHQEQRALMHKLERRFQGRQFASKEEGEIAVQAAIGEFLGCSPRMQLQLNDVPMLWFGLVVVLLAGVWWSRSRWQTLGQ